MSSYLLDGGFRHVLPYFYDHRTSLKERWVGKPLLSVLQAEFGRALPRALLQSMLEHGLVSVGGATITDPFFPLPPLRGPSKSLICRVHRHEPPVLDSPLSIARAGEYLLVDKPPSWPCHPCGPQSRNTLTRIMEAELDGGLRFAVDDEGAEGEGTPSRGGGGGGAPLLRMLYRLDRLVSGLLLFATTEAACTAFHACGAVAEGTTKVYVARLRGRVEPRTLAARAVGRGDGGVVLIEHASWDALLSAWALQPPAADGCVEGFVGAGPRWTAVELLRGGGGAGEPLELHLSYPLLPAPGKRGGRFVAGAVGAGRGKASATRLAALRYCAASDTTFALLRPLTGRTHQLRVHADAVGHAVANCPVYGGDTRWLGDPGDALPHMGTPGGVAGALAHVIAQRRACGVADAVALAGCGFCVALGARSGDGGGAVGGADGSGDGGDGGDELRPPHRARIWLHALSYSFSGHRFRAQLPSWW